MASDTVYFIEPSPNGDYLIALSQRLSMDGYNLSYTSKDVLMLTEMKRVLLEKGTTEILSQQLLNEEVLPDSTQRNTILDTLRNMFDRCSPTQSFLIIDPYIYPSNPDADYQADFISIFDKFVLKCSQLNIVTLPNRNTLLESQIDTAIRQINPNIAISKKYTNVFHDRFWIADDSKGVFVGTSLNGIGRRYAIIEYLHEDDVGKIVQRYNQIP